jgi:cytochrome c biogenesis protein CcmG/thiol:disulfide interchange protein DsbE
MPFIHFITIKAERLAAGIAVFIVALSLAGFYYLTTGRSSTQLPSTALWHAASVTATPTPQASTMQIGALAPDITLPDTKGAEFSLHSLRGQPILLYFWATWCSFCREDLPMLQNLDTEYKAAGLKIVGVNILEKPEVVQNFNRQLGIKYPLLLDSQGLACQAYLVKATPTYVFIDKEGIVRANLVGRPLEAVFAANLALIVPNPPADSSQKTSSSA